MEFTTINTPFISEKIISLKLFRLDSIDMFWGGNKFFKLKYNLEEMKSEGLNTLLTFGGAYSNHIAATAAVGQKHGIQTIGIIRGVEFKTNLNPTLRQAEANGMQLHFVSRDEYRKKESTEFIKELKNKFGKFYLLPEGGSNELAVKGCEEILTKNTTPFNYIACAVGTGATMAGLIRASQPQQKILGFSALNQDGFLNKDVKNLSGIGEENKWEIINNYHFGKYGKVTKELIEFYHNFNSEFGVELDLIYTAKMMHGLFDMIYKNTFEPGTSILAIHTGGVQGNKEILDSGNIYL